MKKFLIVLMVVAMASFLFVGCLPVTPDIPDEDEEEPNQAPVITSAAITSGKVGVVYTYDVNATDPEGDILTYSLTEKPLSMSIVATTGIISWTPTDAGLFTVGVKASDPDGLFDVQGFNITVAAADEPVEPVEPSVAPVITKISDIAMFVFGPDIIDLYSTDTQYMNEDEVSDGIFVMGVAPKYSEIKVYIGEEVVGTGYAYGILERFAVFVDKDNLGEDGGKTICATAEEFGLAESDVSTVYEFILDTVAPEMVKVTAVGVGAPLDITVTATFSEELNEATAEDDLDWTWKNILTLTPLEAFSSAELISPKVVELKGETVLASVGNIVRVAYEDVGNTPIEDLAGNPAIESFEYCWLEEE